MADDVLLTKLYNFICGSGGFVELAVLLKPSSPLGSRKSKQEAKTWLISQGPNANFVCVKDQNGEIAGVRVDLRKKVCHQYASKGNCRIRRRKGSCKYWHICKSYIEGKCDGSVCGLSHDFYNEGNWEIAEELKLEKYSNGAIKNIVAWSLPQVCQLYLRNECTLSECPYLHVCAQFVEGSSCNCALSHNLRDWHNNKILKQYNLVPHTQKINVDFVRCSVLVLNYEQKRIGTGKCLGSGDTELAHKTTSKQDPNLLTNVTKAVVSNPASKQNPSSSRLPEFSSSQPSAANAWNPCFPTEWKVFECLCREYGSSASFLDIAGRKDLFPHGVESAKGWFRETKGSFLITENSQGTIAQVSAFSARARLCLDYNQNGRCDKYGDCTFLHICRDFVTESCSSGVTCPLHHNFHNQRDKAFLSRIKLDQFTDQQLQKLVLCSTPRICVEYNNGTCSLADDCNRIHMCCGYIRKCCSAEYECGLDHEGAMDTDHSQTVLKRHMLGKVGTNDVTKMILDDKLCLPGKEKRKGKYCFYYK